MKIIELLIYFIGKNIFINNLNDQITIVKNPLHSENKISSMNFSNQQIGGALSTFSENFGFDGKKMNTVFSYNTNSFTLDNFVISFLSIIRMFGNFKSRFCKSLRKS